VAHPTAINEFTASREGESVTVSGALIFTGSSIAGAADIAIEFSTDGRTWTQRALLPGQPTGIGFLFSGSITESRVGQWRATYSGGAHFQDAVSQAVAVAAA
jgi:hypothetical protein